MKRLSDIIATQIIYFKELNRQDLYEEKLTHFYI